MTALLLATLLSQPTATPSVNAETDKTALGVDVKVGELMGDSVRVWARPYLENVRDEENIQPGTFAHLVIEIHDGDESAGEAGKRSDALETFVAIAESETDFAVQHTFTSLEPGRSYVVETGVYRTPYDSPVIVRTPIQTPPPADAQTDLLFAAINCIEWRDRDSGADGYKVFDTMLSIGGARPAFCVFTGDTLYYDRPERFVNSVAMARSFWHRQFGTTYLRAFMQEVPAYFEFDDHDVYVDDSWPGRYTKKSGDFRFADGVRTIFEQLPLDPAKPTYRTVRWGKHLQIWLLEGRLHRSPNTMPDGPDKTILGPQQMLWLSQTLRESDATHKIVISQTPIVGPDRENKNDNYANAGFRHEGEQVRAMLAAAGAIVMCGDRHWQYHSIDPATGLHEFSIGPATDEHAAGNPKKQPDWQPFLRVRGGFMSVKLTGGDLTLRHHDVAGEVVHSWSASD